MNVIVTGASRGIGYETVRHLAKDTNNQIIAIARNKPNLIQLKEHCRKLGNQNVHIKSFDLLNDDFSKLEGFVNERFNRLDVLINNAGALLRKPFMEITQKEMQEVFQVNFFRPMLLIQRLFPLLQKSKQAHVVNISSMAGFQGSAKFPGLSIYSSSKASIASLTECLAAEYGKAGIRFNALALGAVETEMLEEAFPGYRAPVSADTMGEYIAGFAMEGNKIFNGSVLPVHLSNP